MDAMDINAGKQTSRSYRRQYHILVFGVKADGEIDLVSPLLMQVVRLAEDLALESAGNNSVAGCR